MVYLPQLSGCLIMTCDEVTLERELDFGSFVVFDRVRLNALREIRIDTEPAPNVSAGRLTIEIEEPGVEQLQLRFTYEVERERSEDAKTEDDCDRFLKSAYLEADIDSVKIIRQLLDRESI